jgi:hypothetical protein
VLSGKPAAKTNSTSASIGFTGEANAAFTCSVDGGAYSACTSPKALSGLAAGAHSLSVKATDQAGNTSTAATASWTVDTTAPVAPTLSGIPGVDNVLTTASIGIAGESGATFTCSLDDAAYAACTSPLKLTGLSTGDHTLLVKQTDAAGNVSPAATADWAVVVVGAPRLIAKVVMKVDLKTKITTLTLKASADTSHGANSVTKLEYYNKPFRPKDTAKPATSFVLTYAATTKLKAGQVAFWVRVQDKKGKWSGWYRTRF